MVTVGKVVGSQVGVSVGILVGDTVGDLVGVSVGFLIGDNVGSLIGVSVGDKVDSLVGDDKGSLVGDSIGTTVDDAVGDEVREIVGLPIVRFPHKKSNVLTAEEVVVATIPTNTCPVGQVVITLISPLKNQKLLPHSSNTEEELQRTLNDPIPKTDPEVTLPEL